MIIGAEVGVYYPNNDEKDDYNIPRERVINYDFENKEVTVDILDDIKEKLILGEYTDIEFEQEFLNSMKRNPKKSILDSEIIRVVFVDEIPKETMNEVISKLGNSYYKSYNRALVNTRLLGLVPKFNRESLLDYLGTKGLDASLISNYYFSEGDDDTTDMLIIYKKTEKPYIDIITESVTAMFNKIKKARIKRVWDLRLHEDKYRVIIPNMDTKYTFNNIQSGTLLDIVRTFISKNYTKAIMEGRGLHDVQMFNSPLYLYVNKNGIFLYLSSMYHMGSMSPYKETMDRYKLAEGDICFSLDNILKIEDVIKDIEDSNYDAGLRINEHGKIKCLEGGKCAKRWQFYVHDRRLYRSSIHKVR